MKQGLVALALACALCTQPLTAQETKQRVLSTAVWIDAPAGFSQSRSFAGFQSEDGASIVVMKLDAGYQEIADGLTESGLRQRGMVLHARQTLERDGGTAVCFRVSQSANGIQFDKWLGLFGDEENTVMVTTTWPAALDDYEDTLLECIRTAEWDPEFEPDPLEGVPFALGDTGGLVLFGNNLGALVWSLSGGPDKTGRDPSFICAPSMQAISGDRRDYAQKRLLQTAKHKHFETKSVTAVRIDDLPGFATVAAAVDSETGDAKTIYQVILYDGAGYWLMQGFSVEEEAEEFLPIFARMARSFRRKHDTLTSEESGVSLSVPATWAIRSGLDDEAQIQAGHQIHDCYLFVDSEPKTELDASVTLKQYATRSRAWIGLTLAGAEPAESELEVDGKAAFQTELHGSIDGYDIAYLHVVIDGEHFFHQVVFWTSELSFTANRAEFERILGTFTEGA